MFTSHYGNLKNITPPLTPVSISRGKPRWLKGGWLAHVQPGTVGRNYDALAPTAASLKADIDEYHRAFAALLASLDPARVYDELGESAVLLCFCEVGQMCHRRIVAEWLEAALNVLIPELGEDPDGNTELWTTPAYSHYMDLEQKQAWYDALTATAAGPVPVPEAPPIPAATVHRPRWQTAHRQTWNAKTRRWEAAK
jgi:hypothetical protein